MSVRSLLCVVGLCRGGHYRFFFASVFFAFPQIFYEFWCLFRPGGCLWSLRGCPLAPEAPQDCFLDAFWADLELLLGGFGVTFRHFSVLFLQCVFGAVLERVFERFRLHVGSLFGAILVSG